MFKAILIGYDTLEWNHTHKEIIVNSKEEAQKYCVNNSCLGGYDWRIESIKEMKEEE